MPPQGIHSILGLDWFSIVEIQSLCKVIIQIILVTGSDEKSLPHFHSHTHTYIYISTLFYGLDPTDETSIVTFAIEGECNGVISLKCAIT